MLTTVREQQPKLTSNRRENRWILQKNKEPILKPSKKRTNLVVLQLQAYINLIVLFWLGGAKEPPYLTLDWW